MKNLKRVTTIVAVFLATFVFAQIVYAVVDIDPNDGVIDTDWPAMPQISDPIDATVDPLRLTGATCGQTGTSGGQVHGRHQT